jgi:hypothetical protein
MTNPPWPRLSHDELATIIGDYYKFLVKFYIPELSLKFPPPGGWPSITPETTEGFPRSPMVIDLLKHLPYIDEEHAGTMITHINYKCDVADYSTMTPEQWAEDDQWQADNLKEWIDEIRESKREESQDEDGWEEGYLWYRDEDRDKSADKEENWFDGDEEEDMKMENMIVLASGYESGGLNLILDVFKGEIHEDQIRASGLTGHAPVEDYFGDLKSKLERLEIVPIPGYGRREGDFWEGATAIPVDVFGESVTFDENEDVRECQKIYKSFAWPGEAYRKEEAVAAIQTYMKRARAREEA